jgi:streptomycin 6-kinase
MAEPHVPALGKELRLRLRRRYGNGIDAWLDELPTVLAALRERWALEYDSLIQRGSMSVVVRCRERTGQAAVLKICPDRSLLANEARALGSWRTSHVPAVVAVDEARGALLIEAIEPGTPLVELAAYPRTECVVDLVASLQSQSSGRQSFRPVSEHITHLFDSSRRLYEWKPELVDLISPDVYERGRKLAMRLAENAPRSVLLHGDLTAVNILDGGADRGLVAIDPAPCLGDPAFDVVDLVFWLARDAATIEMRAKRLALGIGADAGRVLAWCSAFAAMVALEIAEDSDCPSPPLEPLLALASSA